MEKGNWTETKKMAELSLNVAIITLNVNGLTTPIQRVCQSVLKNMTLLYAFFQKLQI